MTDKTKKITSTTRDGMESWNLRFPVELISMMATLATLMRTTKTQFVTEMVVSGAYNHIQAARNMGIISQEEIDAVMSQHISDTDDTEVTADNWREVYRAYNALLQKVFARCPVFRKLIETGMRNAQASQTKDSEYVPGSDMTAQ